MLRTAEEAEQRYLGATCFYHRVYTPGQLQFITASTYRRTPLFLSDRFRHCFVQRLEQVRQELHFLPVGWVLMPRKPGTSMIGKSQGETEIPLHLAERVPQAW